MRLSPLLIVILFLAGCSSKEVIGKAAQQVNTAANSITTELTAAKATKEIGPKAMPHIEKAAESAGEISSLASKIVGELPGIEDKESPFWKFLKSAGFLIFIVCAVVLSVFYAPVIKPVLLVIGAWLRIIPKPIQIDARADAAYIAEPTPVDNSDIDRIRAIELKKADPRYKVALDAELVAKGIPT